MPGMEVDSVAGIDPETLRARGVRAVGLDADQTLCGWHGQRIDDRLLESIEAMDRVFAGRLCIISNCSEGRLKELQENFPLEIVPARPKKPDVGPFRVAERRFGIESGAWAFVGDRLLTDVVGANRSGWLSILTQPLVPASDPLWMRAMRRYEAVLRKLYRF